MQTPRPGPERTPPEPAEPRRRPARKDEPSPRYDDPVDEASAESMIASDPPARSGFRVGPAKKTRSKTAAS